MPTLLVKSEPSTYSFEDLLRDKTTRWDGVKNPAALAALRAAKKGDDVLVYHSGDVKAIVGLARVEKAAYQDPKHPGLNDQGQPKFAVIDLKAVKAAKTPAGATLAAIKADPRFKDFALVRIGRLSVMPVPPALDIVLRAMAGL
jgi:predicted RNA-binding protein with PUA-like domain